MPAFSAASPRLLPEHGHAGVGVLQRRLRVAVGALLPFVVVLALVLSLRFGLPGGR